MAAAKDRDTLVHTNLQKARSEISDAEGELQKVIAALGALPRAEKVTASKVVHAAFKKLESANARLDDLEKVLTKKR